MLYCGEQQIGSGYEPGDFNPLPTGVVLTYRYPINLNGTGLDSSEFTIKYGIKQNGERKEQN